MYYEGCGVKEDNREAVRWYHKAAEQGDTDAQVNLGLMYEKGFGVAQDIVQSHKWFNIALALGDKSARIWQQGFEPLMSAQQIGQAQTEATKWLEAYQKRRK